MKTKSLSICANLLASALLCSACDTMRPWAPYVGHVVLEELRPTQCDSIPGGERDVCVFTRAVHEVTRIPVQDVRVSWRPGGGATVKQADRLTDSEGVARARLLPGAPGEMLVEVRLTDRPSYAVTLNPPPRP